MKYVPHSPQGCLLLTLLEEVQHSSSHREEDSSKILKQAVAHIQFLEGDEVRGGSGNTEVITDSLYRWIKASIELNTKEADFQKSRLKVDAKEHSFPFELVLEKYMQHFTLGESLYDRSLKNYRAWNQAPWNENSNFGMIKAEISPTAKIGIIGDWGTGTDDASYLLECMFKKAPDLDLILHLGDIYRSGTPYECLHNFTKPINAAFTALDIPQIPVLTIPGNHEYWSAGKGYFEMLGSINRGLSVEWQQEASYFCLRSSDRKWQIIGTDTGLESTVKSHSSEPGLLLSEQEWVKKRFEEFDSAEGRTILLTHHQFVSADFRLNSSRGTERYFNRNLNAQLQALLPNIDLWLWGHDHWFIPYIPNLPVPALSRNTAYLKQGQLLGGSARETYHRSIQFHGTVQSKDGKYILPDSHNGLINHTYGILDLADASVSYYQVGAWEQSDPPNRYAPPGPLYVQNL